MKRATSVASSTSILLALAAGACSSEDYASSSGTRPTQNLGTAGSAGDAGRSGGGQAGGGQAGAGAGGAGQAGSGGGSAGGPAGGGGAAGAPMAVVACNEHPWDCPMGTTCWPTSADGKTFDCRKSEPVATGSCCQNVIGFATCGDGDLCYGTSSSPSACRRQCKLGDTSHPCPSSTTCTEHTLVPGGATFGVCEPAAGAMCSP